MNGIKAVISETFYTQPLTLLCAVIAFVIGLIHRNRFRELKFMFVYSLSSILQILSLYYDVYFQLGHNISIMTVNLFIIVESSVFFVFFRNIIKSRSVRMFIDFIFLMFATYVVLVWSSTKAFYKDPTRIYLPESLCILSFCFLYFFELFKLPAKPNLLQNPSFWITIGCLFYFSCTIPLFFLDTILDFFPNYNSFYSINYLAYSVLFLLIAKSYLCNPLLAK